MEKGGGLIIGCMFLLDQHRFPGNHPSTPSLTQHFAPSETQTSTLSWGGGGGGEVGSFSETKIDPFCFQVKRPITEAGRGLGEGGLPVLPFIEI